MSEPKTETVLADHRARKFRSPHSARSEAKAPSFRAAFSGGPSGEASGTIIDAEA
jgi:hypothetical protein